MSFSPLSEKLNENNYRTWAVEMCAYLNARQLWRFATGEEPERVMPMVPGTWYHHPFGVNYEDTKETGDTKVGVGERGRRCRPLKRTTALSRNADWDATHVERKGTSGLSARDSREWRISLAWYGIRSTMTSCSDGV
jgi:hypothetical protein